jgi:hypothetical protein
VDQQAELVRTGRGGISTVCDHPQRSRAPAANLRSWRVIIMRSRGEYLGSVEAPYRESAEVVTE